MGTSNKTNVTLRSDKSSPLTREEMDGNFSELENVIDDSLANEQRLDAMTPVDYTSGLTITSYAQIVKDESGDFWRVSGSTTLPYTTDGTGLPEGGAFVAVGDADIRNDLAAGVVAGKGGLLVAGAVIYVDTIADLQALDTSELVGGQQVQVKEYHTGMGVGGGVFYLTLDAQFEHDDGTVFDTQGAQFVRVAGSVVTPLSFGAVNSTEVDSSEAINKFFQCAALTPSGRYIFEFAGTYGTSQTLTLSGFVNKHMAMEATVQALSSLDVIFNFNGCVRSSFPGRLTVTGTGGSSLASNTCMDAIQITQCGRSEFGVLSTSRGRRWGVNVTSSGNSLIHIHQIEALDFGASNRSTRVQSIDVVSFSKTGSSSSLSQTSVLTVSNPENLPPTIDSYVVVAGFPHAVQSVDVDNSTIEIFPWIRDSDEVPGEYGVVYGGGVTAGHVNSAKIEVGTIFSTRCGLGAYLTSASAPNVGRFMGQFNGVSLALGGMHGTRIFSGVDISSVYFEAEAVAEIVSNSTSSTYSNGSSLTCVSSANPSKWFALAARYTNGAIRNNRYFPVEVLVNNVRWPLRTFRDINRSVGGSGGDLIAYTLRPLSHHSTPQHVQAYRGDVTLNLRDDKDFRRLKGMIPVSALVTGGGSNGNYTGTLYVAAQDGYTINGMESPIRLASNPNPFRVTAWLTSETNWRIAVEDLTPPTLFE